MLTIAAVITMIVILSTCQHFGWLRFHAVPLLPSYVMIHSKYVLCSTILTLIWYLTFVESTDDTCKYPCKDSWACFKSRPTCY